MNLLPFFLWCALFFGAPFSRGTFIKRQQATAVGPRSVGRSGEWVTRISMAEQERKAWLASHGVEAALRSAVAQVIIERPSNPLAAIGRAMLKQAKVTPTDICDPHLHFYDPEANAAWAPVQRTIGLPIHAPEAYAKEIASLGVTGSVHVEAVPADGAAEAQWVNSLIAAGRAPTVKAIVAGVDLGAPEVEKLLERAAAVPRVVGIRWILDDFREGAPARVPGSTEADYLLDKPAGAAARFEAGFKLLAKFGLRFDLQCGPRELEAAARLCARHPDVPVVVDHLGKPKGLRGDGSSADAKELAWWRTGLAMVAHAGPHTYVKLSMLGFAVPGWYGDAKKEAFVRALVLDVIRLFGAHRCMFASNWHMHAAMSNSDTADARADACPGMGALYAKFQAWVAHLPTDEQHALFSGTARAFYRITKG